MTKAIKKPKCQECKSSKQVVLVVYKNKKGLVYWEGYECEACCCVVKEIYNG